MTANATLGDSALSNLTRIQDDAAIEERTVRRLERLLRRSTTPVAVARLDLDKSSTLRSVSIDLKVEVLGQLGAFLRSEAPPGTVVISHGTRDDFTLLVPLPDTPFDPDAALASVDRLREAVGATTFRTRESVACQLTISGGIAVHPQHGTSAASLILLADGACRRAKEQGRNRCVVAEPGLHHVLETRLLEHRYRALAQRSAELGVPLEALLREAIELVLQRHSGLERFSSGLEERRARGA